jgi:hypothetical protein
VSSGVKPRAPVLNGSKTITPRPPGIAVRGLSRDLQLAGRRARPRHRDDDVRPGACHSNRTIIYGESVLVALLFCLTPIITIAPLYMENPYWPCCFSA